MTAQIVELKQWAEDHPPAVRLLTIWAHCGEASLRLYSAWWRAVLSLPLR